MFKKTRLVDILQWSFAILLALIIIPLFVPLAPKMPDSGIDPSWATALNQAVAQKLSFGKQIIFTLGPYASIYTKVYHPATDVLMMTGSFYLACSYWLALLILMKKVQKRWILGFVLLISAMIYVKDSLLFSYPLILGLISYKSLFHKQQNKSLLLWFLLFAPLGLFMLIKCSLILLSLSIMVLCMLFFIVQGVKENSPLSFKIASLCCIAPCLCLLFFWVFSGQSLSNLPYYLFYSIYFVFVFTEPMAKEGPNLEIILYLISSILILMLIYTQKQTRFKEKLFLLTLFGIFLFFSYKTGFTRPNHALISGVSLLIAALLLPFVLSSPLRLAVILISLVNGCYITSQYRSLSLKDNLLSTYSSSWYGLKSRISDANWLSKNFALIMSFQRAQIPIPHLQGTTDIYSYEQTSLIASGNIWSPRPIFQSYSTFTPLLAEKNKHHLEGNRGADTILFKIEPIDNRLPALEDSASWPFLLKNYQFSRQENRFLYLHKRTSTPVYLSSFKKESHRLGEVITLPNNDQLLFIAMDIKPSLPGFLNLILFKPGQLTITLELKNGLKKSYRLSATMAKSSFLLSPLIESTDEFAYLYSQENFLANKQIKSFTLEAPSNTHWQWQNEFLIDFKHMAG